MRGSLLRRAVTLALPALGVALAAALVTGGLGAPPRRRPRTVPVPRRPHGASGAAHRPHTSAPAHRPHGTSVPAGRPHGASVPAGRPHGASAPSLRAHGVPGPARGADREEDALLRLRRRLAVPPVAGQRVAGPALSLIG